ncbi:MAG: diaminopimelate epimerase [Acidobacteriota bacterium]
MPFWKMAGAGNDFLIFDNRGGSIADPARLAAAICTRRLSVGGDGLILIEPSLASDFRMAYFNADGSRGEFCANGTRCAARFALLNGIAAEQEMIIETDAGRVPARVEDGLVTLSLPGPERIVQSKRIDLGGKPVTGMYMWVGVPHFVVVSSSSVGAIDVESSGREIRHHPDLAPEGANVNFVRVLSREAIEVRTYERGVEAETLSCGSGVVASVSACAMTGSVDSPVSVLTRSGIRLIVTVDWLDGGIRGLTLSGDARVIFKGVVTPETTGGYDPDRAHNPTSGGARP